MHKKIKLIGMKPTEIHLGHLLSIFQYAFQNSDVYFLIADYHKFSSIHTAKEINEQVKIVEDFIKAKKFPYVKQSDFKEIYCDLYFHLSGLVGLNYLNKIYEIHKLSSQNNLMKYSYPVLMMLDIYLFSPCEVIVAMDQIHHMRYITKQITKLFNKNVDVTCDMLKIKICTPGSSSKMSTSDGASQIYLTSSYEDILKIIKLTKTSSTVLPFDEIGEDLKNLFNIVQIIGDQECIDMFKFNRFNNYLELKIKVSQCIYNYICKIKSQLYQYNPAGLIDVRERFESNYNFFRNYEFK